MIAGTQSAGERDEQDALAPLREEFALPADTVYLDGNSLGALPKRVVAAVQNAVSEQWGEDLIASWNRHDWIRLPALTGERIAPLIGAEPGQVLCADSISVNLFKLLASALALQPGRRSVLAVHDDFPTDAYIAQGLAQHLGEERCRLRRVAMAELESALDDDVAVVLLTQVNYRSGECHDMRAITEAAHAAGALVLWDLAHSAGVVPIELDRLNVDMAVGCGYKYLNGGPGAPGFVYLNRRHHERARQPLTGWLGHASPFDFDPDYAPAPGVASFQAGTPPILSMTALYAALELFAGTDLQAIRDKSLALTDFFMQGLAERGLDERLSCLTPRDHERRGSQVSLQHSEAWGISQALIEAGIVVDFRAPDIVRFGFAPLYNSFTDAQQALEKLAGIIADRRYQSPRFAKRPTVT